MSDTARKRMARQILLLPLHPQLRTELFDLWNRVDVETHAEITAENATLTAALARCVEALEDELGIYSPKFDEDRIVDARNEVVLQSKRIHRMRAALASPEVAACAATGGTQ